MNSIDFSILAGIVAIVALVSPILTSIIDNSFKLAIKKKEFEQIKESEHDAFIKRVFENYLSATGKIINLSSPDNKTEYGSAYGLILFYISDDISNEIINCHSHIKRHDWDQADKSFTKVARLIKSKYLQ